MPKVKLNSAGSPTAAGAPQWDVHFVRLLVITSIFRLILAAFAELKYEEAYYWDYSQHPELSYFDHPPMIGWLIRALTSIAGDSELWVRTAAVLLFAGTMIFFFRLARELFDSRTAFVASAIAMLLPAFEWYSFMAMPDAPLMFFWMCGTYFGYRLVTTQKPLWWLVIGVCWGCGMLSKYPGLLIPLAPILYALYKRQWKLLFCWELPTSGLIALGFFSPVIIWNSQHQWASFLFQGVSRFSEANSFIDIVGGSLLNQALLLTPFGLFLMAWALLASLRLFKDEKYTYLLCACLPFSALLLVVSFSRLIQMNWTLPIYLTLTIVLAARLLEDNAARLRKTSWRIALGLVFIPAFIFSVLPWVAVAVPMKVFNRVNEYTGWSPMAKSANELRTCMPDFSHTFLAGHGYHTAAELAYYTRQPELTLSNNVIGEEAKGFDYWLQPQELKGWDCVYVVCEELKSDGSFESRTGFDMKKLALYFDNVQRDEKLTVFNGGGPIRRFRFYLCSGYYPPDAHGLSTKPRPSAPKKTAVPNANSASIGNHSPVAEPAKVQQPIPEKLNSNNNKGVK